MKFLSPSLVTLFSSLLVGTSSTEILETGNLDPQLVVCTLYTIAATTKKGVNRGLSSPEEFEYLCETEGNISYKIYGDVEEFFGSSYQSSRTTLTFPVSIAQGGKAINLDDDIVKSSTSFSNPETQGGIQKSGKEGTFKGLIIRVSDNTGDTPPESANDLYGAFFEDSINYGVSVKSVLLGCSDDKFEIVPATGSAVTDGVVEITVGYAVKGKYYSDVSDDVLALLPSSTINDYTYTFMVFPESVELSSSGGNTIGKGNLPGFKTWYKGGNVQWVGLGVHEIGHNLNQYHSGGDYNGNGIFDDDEEDYDDPTCTMGGETGEKSDGQKCFNAAKTYYLGWFLDYHSQVTPTNSAFDGTLVGVNDAGNDEISSDQYVTIQISDAGETDLFLMYNRVEGVHKFLENIYYEDKVVVVEQSEEAEQSWVIAVLDQGETYTQKNWAGSGNSLEIKVCSISNGTPDIAKIGIWLEGVNNVANCKAAPTISPAPTPLYKEIKYVGNPCSEAFPLTGKCTECTGDCDDDSDCEGDLLCYQRDGDEDVPGCVWGDNSALHKADDSDYCYSPDAPEGVVSYKGECDSSNLCGRCSGDCDSDRGCEDGLECFQRDDFEAVPGCTGEGGLYDKSGSDVCYSISPVAAPIAAPVAAPVASPTSTTCEDSTLRFRVLYNGNKISRDCGWVAKKSTKLRCAADGVPSHCPVACGTSCSPCIDASNRFRLTYDGKKISRDCSWVAKRSTKLRCAADGVTDTCRLTCGACS